LAPIEGDVLSADSIGDESIDGDADDTVVELKGKRARSGRPASADPLEVLDPSARKPSPKHP
jgi:hypothetical protein